MAYPEVIECDSVPQFIDRLTNNTEGFGPPNFRSPWVYRGHADAQWELKASAWRQDGQAKLSPLKSWLQQRVLPIVEQHDKSWTASHRLRTEARILQVVAEVHAVKQFCDLADELGLTIPGSDRLLDLDETITLAGFGYRYMSLDNDAPTEVFPPIPFSFAQHHGIPTRFLDWTQNPLVAAYFASSESAENASHLAVWAYAITSKDRPFGGMKWTTAPRSQHHYLHAQSGVFSTHPDGDTFYMNSGKWPTFIEGISPDGPNPANHPLKKFVLPTRLSHELLRELHRRRISRAHLMPTFDQVAAVIKENWNWR